MSIGELEKSCLEGVKEWMAGRAADDVMEGHLLIYSFSGLKGVGVRQPLRGQRSGKRIA
jgi:hypothetical protein